MKKLLVVLLGVMLLSGCGVQEKRAEEQIVQEKKTVQDLLADEIRDNLDADCPHGAWIVECINDVFYMEHAYVVLDAHLNIKEDGDWYVDGCPTLEEIKERYPEIEIRHADEYEFVEK